MITSDQIKAARALVRMSQATLASDAGLSTLTIKRMEGAKGPGGSYAANVAAVQTVLENAGVEFIPENGGGPGVRLKRRSP